MSYTGMSARDNPHPGPMIEHLNIKVSDNNELFFKVKRTTQLKKLMGAFCERQGKPRNAVSFPFDGTRVNDKILLTGLASGGASTLPVTR